MYLKLGILFTVLYFFFLYYYPHKEFLENLLLGILVVLAFGLKIGKEYTGMSKGWGTIILRGSGIYLCAGTSNEKYIPLREIRGVIVDKDREIVTIQYRSNNFYIKPKEFNSFVTELSALIPEKIKIYEYEKQFWLFKVRNMVIVGIPLVIILMVLNIFSPYLTSIIVFLLMLLGILSEPMVVILKGILTSWKKQR